MIPQTEKPTYYRKGKPVDREEAQEKVGTRIRINEHLYRNVPEGTTGTVIHVNLVHRFYDPDYGHTDLYELVVAWDLPMPIVTTIDETAYAGCLTELEGGV
jgi:hypothetical protein